MYKIVLLLLFFGTYGSSKAQNSNVWLFGDSAGIDFRGSTPVPFTSAMDGRGSCASFCDSANNIKMYAITLIHFS
jgi:hypothetical protein